MTEAAAAVPAARAVGTQRGPWFVALIGLLTLGIYWIYWYYKTGEEIKNALKGIAPNRDETETRAPTGPRVSVPLAPRPDPELA